MRKGWLFGILCFTSLATPIQAGINLGMKLACKRYGEAMNSGSQGAVASCCTGDFAAQWYRVPSDIFASIPRGGSGQVLSSSKSNGSGRVTVSTNQGVVTFLLVGGGFNWRVADIIKPGDDGVSVSVKNYLDASLTSGDFIRTLKRNGGTSFYSSITGNFQNSFQSLDGAELDRVRRFLPELGGNTKPFVQMRNDYAAIRFQIPGRAPGDVAIFHMRRQGRWLVDDYQIASGTTNIASMRSGIGVVAAVTGMNEFVKNPEGLDPREFTAPGELRDALLYAKSVRPFPLPSNGERRFAQLLPDQKTFQVEFDGKTVVFETCHHEGRVRLCKVTAITPEAKMNVAQVLLMRKSVADMTAGMLASKALPVSVGGLINASAKTFEPSDKSKPVSAEIAQVPAAQPQTNPPAIPQPAKLAAQLPVAGKVEPTAKPAVTVSDSALQAVSAVEPVPPTTTPTVTPAIAVAAQPYVAPTPTWQQPARNYTPSRSGGFHLFGRRRR